MLKRTMIAAAAVLAVAIAPAVASAGTHVEFASEKDEFTMSGNPVKLVTPSATVECAEPTGSGEFENETTGAIQLALRKCKGPLGTSCTTSGQSTGTITTTKLTLYAASVKEEPAVLITPNEGHFASFKCGLISVQVTGNGVVGAITEPGYEEESKTIDFAFNQSEGKQELTKIDGSEIEYGLKASINGGEKVPAALETSGEGFGLIAVLAVAALLIFAS
jgi:hypothetical protein